MKPNKQRGDRLARVRWSLWLLLTLVVAPVTRAETVLLSDTTLITGSESSVFSFQAPGPGTLIVQLTDVKWPQTLSSLSFMATNGSHVLESWSDPGSQLDANLTFQITGGRYFADVMAAAGGPLDLGVYSLSIDFKSANSPVPLPASGWLLLAGVLAFAALRLTTFARRPAH